MREIKWYLRIACLKSKELSSKPFDGLNIRRHSAKQWHFRPWSSFWWSNVGIQQGCVIWVDSLRKNNALSISTLRTHKIRYLQTYCSRPSYNCQSWINELPSRSQSSAKWNFTEWWDSGGFGLVWKWGPMARWFLIIFLTKTSIHTYEYVSK